MIMRERNNKIIKQYLKEVADNIVCNKSVKRFYMNEIKQILGSYSDGKPELTLEDLHREFGSPEKFATDLSGRDEFSDLLKKAKKKSNVWMCIGIAFIVLFIVAVWFIVYILPNLGGTVNITNSFSHS